MFPIGDEDVRGASPPVITWVFVGLNVVVFLYQLSLGQAELEQFYMTFGVVPAQVIQGQNLSSLLVSMFMHGGWAHIINNMIFLWVFGDNVEAILGKVLYPIFYVGGGLAASAAHIAFNLGSQVPSLGASGAVAAVLGAYVVMFPQSRVKLLIFFGYIARVTQVAAVIFVGIWFVTQLLSGVASLGPATAQTGGVAYWAHIGGFILGLLIGFFFKDQAEDRALSRTSV